MGAALKQFDTLALIIVTSLLAVDGYLWMVVFAAHGPPSMREYILDVGQGDSELLVFPGNVKIMTDAGPKKGQTSAVIDALQNVLAPGDRAIDLAVITHPDSDHFAGYLDVLDRYEVGAVLYNGRDGPSDAWRDLMAKIAAKHVPLVTIGAGDRIHYGANEIDILSPDAAFAESAETNDTSIMEMVRVNEDSPDAFRSLLTGDAPLSIENHLLALDADMHADVLKVAHHGSKYSSGNAFLRAVNPVVAAIGVGANNVYGHPSKEALTRIASSTHAQVFRTDRNGTIEIFSQNGKLDVLVEKSDSDATQ